MRFPLYVSQKQIKQLEYEVLSKEFYIYLTRYLLRKVEETEYAEDIIARKNRIINLSNTIIGDKIYVLTSDDMGCYEQAEYDWHDSTFLLIFRRLNTIEFIEFTCELLNSGYLELDFINSALKTECASFSFTMKNGEPRLKIIDNIEDVDITDEHPNIRVLVSRMDSCFDKNDFSGVLHSSASIFETMAKGIIGLASIQNKTLKSFFDRYKKESRLPEPILQYILDVYDKRNITPLAGHGSLEKPAITKDEAIILLEMTKSFVRIESKLKDENIHITD